MGVAHTASPTVDPSGGAGAVASPKDTLFHKGDHLRRCAAGPDTLPGDAGCCPAHARSAAAAAGPPDDAPAAPPRDTLANRTDGPDHIRCRSRREPGTMRRSADAPRRLSHCGRWVLLIGPLDFRVRMCESPPSGWKLLKHPDRSPRKPRIHPDPPEAFILQAGTRSLSHPSALRRAMMMLRIQTENPPRVPSPLVMTSLDYMVKNTAVLDDRSHFDSLRARWPKRSRQTTGEVCSA